MHRGGAFSSLVKATNNFLTTIYKMSSTIYNYDTDGDNILVPIPPNATRATIEIWGGDGGRATGGENLQHAVGGYTYIDIDSPVSIQLQLGGVGVPANAGGTFDGQYIGGGGANIDGLIFAGGGGAASRVVVNALAMPAVAGGGAGQSLQMNAALAAVGNGGGVAAPPLVQSLNATGGSLTVGVGGEVDLAATDGSDGIDGAGNTGASGVGMYLGGGTSTEASGGGGGGFGGGGSGAIQLSNGQRMAGQSGGGSGSVASFIGFTATSGDANFVANPLSGSAPVSGSARVSFFFPPTNDIVITRYTNECETPVFFSTEPGTICCPPSGSTFPLGDSEVLCQDERGRTTTRIVRVLPQ